MPYREINGGPKPPRTQITLRIHHSSSPSDGVSDPSAIQPTHCNAVLWQVYISSFRLVCASAQYGIESAVSRIDPMCLADYAVSKMPGPSHPGLGVRVASVTSGAFEQTVPSSDCRCRRLSGEGTADSAYARTSLLGVPLPQRGCASLAPEVNSCCGCVKPGTRYAPQRRSPTIARAPWSL